MRRIFVKSVLEDSLTITGEDAHHLGRVMRAKVGDHIVVADDIGQVGEYAIQGFTENTITMSLVTRLEENTESPLKLTLIQCLPKGDKMDLIVQKATELGVNRIIPVASANCVVRYDNKKAVARQAKWQKIANEAGKQCGRSQLPEVAPIGNLKDLLVAIQQEKTSGICMCYENEEQQGIKNYLQSQQGAQHLQVIIGPEGGFSLEEADLAQAAGVTAVSLGTRILRAETAAIAAMTVMQYENGDLGGR